MTPIFAVRLCLDLIAAGLLVFGLSYWWLGGAAHEAAGVAMFALVVGHNVFNRRWYRRAAANRGGGPINVAVTVALGLTMLALLATSAVLATFLPEWASPGAVGIARQVHVLAAYWAFVIVAMHLGLRWPMIMGVARRAFGLVGVTWWRTTLLRLAALAIAGCGVWSLWVLQFAARLSNQLSLDWWNFDESVIGFFVHCVAAAGLLIAIGTTPSCWCDPTGYGHAKRWRSTSISRASAGECFRLG